MRSRARGGLTVALVIAALAVGCAGAASPPPSSPSTRGAPSAPGLDEEQGDADASNLAHVVWAADSEEPSIWSARAGRDYFVPRLGLRFTAPPALLFETSLSPSQETVLAGPMVPRSLRSARLYGDRELRFRDAANRPVIVSLREIPMEVEPTTFCAWAASAGGRAYTVARDEGERMADSTTRVCDLERGGDRTRMRVFLRAGWLLVIEQPIASDGTTSALEELVRTVRPFADEG